MINLTARYPFILSVLFLIISAAVSIYFYKDSTLPALKKYFLIALKTIAVFLILVLFIEPSIIALIKGNSDRINLVLVDNSRSNTLPGTLDEQKSDELKQILNNGFLNDGSAKIITFSNPETSKNTTINNLDSINFNGSETDLSTALSSLKKGLINENIAAVTVISDGVFNAGPNPLYQARLFQCPVVTIGIGDTTQKKDAVLSAVYFEKKAFTQTENTIKSVINSFELKDENLEINLFREGSLVQTKNILVNSSSQSDEINFQVRESNAGITRYSINITGINGEITYLNNKQEFLIDYVDNKSNILLISSGPGYDNAVIANILKRINNYNITVRTVKNPNKFYEGNIDYKTFGGLSVIFLLGFPTTGFSTEIAGTIAVKAREFNVPIIFFAQKNTDYKKLEAFGEQIPFVAARPNSGETQFNPQAVTSSENNFKNIESEINSAPQIFRNVSGIIQKAGSITLMTDKSSGESVFITNNSGKSKSSAFLGYGLWRWNLNERISHEKTLEKFIIESVNLTLLKDKKTKLKVYPAKDVFDYTEKVKLFAEVYDDEYKPTRNAKVTAKILQNGIVISNDILFTTDENKYTAMLPSLPIEDYTIEAEAELNNNFYAKDNSRFLVDSINTEFLITKSNFDNLKQLSQNTGGEYFDASTDFNVISDKLSSILASEIQNIQEKKERFNLWENKYLLFLIIILFSIEWVVKKRNNIP